MRLLGLRLGSEPHVVGRLGSGMLVSASFQMTTRPVGRLGLGLGCHVLGRLWSIVWVSVNFQIFALTAGVEMVIVRRGNVRGECPGGEYVRGWK